MASPGLQSTRSPSSLAPASGTWSSSVQSPDPASWGGGRPSSPSRSDTVLVRCQATIERLHAEVEEERQRRREAQHQLQQLELRQRKGPLSPRTSWPDELGRTAAKELEREKGLRQEAESRLARVERDLADAKRKLQGGSPAHLKYHRPPDNPPVDFSLERVRPPDLQSSAARHTQELCERRSQIVALEKALRHAEARATMNASGEALASAQAAAASGEAQQNERDMCALRERLALRASDASQLCLRLDAETARADRAESDLAALRLDIDACRGSMLAAEEGHQQQLRQATALHDRLAVSWRDREQELVDSVAAKALRREAGNAELAELRFRLEQSEAGELRLRETQRAQDSAEFRSQRDIVHVEDKGKLHRRIEELEMQLSQQFRVHRAECAEELHRERSAHKAELTKAEARFMQEATTLKETTDAELYKITLELSECRAQRMLLQEQLLHLQLNERLVQLPDVSTHSPSMASAWPQSRGACLASLEASLHASLGTRPLGAAPLGVGIAVPRRDFDDSGIEAKKQAEELIVRLERTNAELRNERESRAAIQQVAQQSRADAQRLAVTLRLQEEESARLKDDLRQAQQKLVDSQCEVQKSRSLLVSASSRMTDVDAEAHHCVDKEVRQRMFDVEANASRVSEEKAERLRHKYEQKLASMQQDLSDRKAYEHRLKSLIEEEVGVLQKYNLELENGGQGNRKHKHNDSKTAEDIVETRLKGLASKVERKILRSLRNPQGGL